jgi:hypothetical protein
MHFSEYKQYAYTFNMSLLVVLLLHQPLYWRQLVNVFYGIYIIVSQIIFNMERI